MATTEPERLDLYLVGETSGIPQPYQVFFDGPQELRDGVRLRYGRNLRDEPVVQKIAVGGAPTERLLSREARIGRDLFSAAPRAYPRQLSRYIGTGDGSHPYTLFTCFGRPLSEFAGQGAPFSPEDFRTAVDDLFQALVFLHTDRLVHGRVGLESLRWDGKNLQLGDFRHTELAGRARPGPAPEPPWAAPRPADERRALLADDVYAAGLVIFLLGTGEALAAAEGGPESAAGMRARLAVQDAVIRDLLCARDRRTGRDRDNVFAEVPDHRPNVRTLRQRWRPPEAPAGVIGPLFSRPRSLEQEEARARTDFAVLRERQHAFALAHPGLPQAGGWPPDRELSDPGPRRNLMILLALIGFAVLVIVIAAVAG